MTFHFRRIDSILFLQYVFGRKELYSNCYELTPVFSQLLLRPVKLRLIPTERYPSTRTVFSLFFFVRLFSHSLFALSLFFLLYHSFDNSAFFGVLPYCTPSNLSHPFSFLFFLNIYGQKQQEIVEVEDLIHLGKMVESFTQDMFHYQQSISSFSMNSEKGKDDIMYTSEGGSESVRSEGSDTKEHTTDETDETTHEKQVEETNDVEMKEA